MTTLPRHPPQPLRGRPDDRRPDPLDLLQRTFFVLPSAALNERIPSPKTLALPSLHAPAPALVAHRRPPGAVRAATKGTS